MKKIKWPKDKKFALCLTHDVDRVKKSFQAITHFFIEKKPYHLISLFSKTNPYWSFEKIMEIEKKHNVRSTFFFLKETKKFKILHPSTYGLSLGYYDFKTSPIPNIIKTLDEGGWEIGLHGSYHSFNNKNLLLKEKNELEQVLGKPVIGIRQHFLNLNIPQTWEIQKDIGFKYDASFGYLDQIGFKEDKILPFQPLDNNFLEIPTTIMDSNLFSYYNEKERWGKIISLIDVAEKNGGIINILWHQRVFNDKEFPGWATMYENIIQECKKRNAYICNAKDIFKIFTKNSE